MCRLERVIPGQPGGESRGGVQLLGCKEPGAARMQRMGWGGRQQCTRGCRARGLCSEEGACVSLDIFQEN